MPSGTLQFGDRRRYIVPDILLLFIRKWSNEIHVQLRESSRSSLFYTTVWIPDQVIQLFGEVYGRDAADLQYGGFQIAEFGGFTGLRPGLAWINHAVQYPGDDRIGIPYFNFDVGSGCFTAAGCRNAEFGHACFFALLSSRNRSVFDQVR